MKMTTFSVCLTLMFGLCQGEIWEIPLSEQMQDCYNKLPSADIETYVGSTVSWMCENIILDSQLNKSVPLDDQQISYYKHLLERSAAYVPGSTDGPSVPRRKRQVTTRRRCLRREYRVLSDEERGRYHRAINALKNNRTVAPNKYDAIALLHTRAVDFAHSGAGFLGWHRIYIRMYETALQEVDPSICLPFWDTTLDNELEDPTLSSVWTPEFFGTSNGPVVDGPFANWRRPNRAQLMRNAGAEGQLFAATEMEDVLSRRSYRDIIFPVAEPRYNLEFYHDDIHMFCGGTMTVLSTAAYDPIFFMVHAFIDFVWELFRANLQGDPEEYPNIVEPGSFHHSNTTIFRNLLQATGYLNAISDDYELPPVCSSTSPQCGSRHLTCLERIGRCVPFPAAMAVASPPDPDNTASLFSLDSQPPGGNGTDTKCLKEEKSVGEAIQNDFCCDDKCDSNEWVTIPVEIISVRPPNFNRYDSYPVYNGLVDKHNDIYSPRAYAHTNRFITERLGNPKTYKRCTGDGSVGHVYLSSRGINYNGFYKEAAIVDQRLAVSMSIGFVAVKKPRGAEVSQALIRAHDSCGRVCRAACKDKLTGQYKPCKGAIAVSSGRPLMYGTTYDEAVMNVFDYEINNTLPQFKSNNIFMSFHCDYHADFPYTDYKQGVVSQAPVIVEPLSVVPPSNTECVVTPQCILDIPCASAERQCKVFNEKHVCRGSCQEYGVCAYGRYFLKVCPEGHSFDNVLKICMPGGCQNNQTHTQYISTTEGNPTGDVSGSTARAKSNSDKY